MKLPHLIHRWVSTSTVRYCWCEWSGPALPPPLLPGALMRPLHAGKDDVCFVHLAQRCSHPRCDAERFRELTQPRPLDIAEVVSEYARAARPEPVEGRPTGSAIPWGVLEEPDEALPTEGL